MDNYLYKITNTVNNKVYIGITKDPYSRQKQHLVWKNQSSNSVLKLAVNKYGSEFFTFEILAIGSYSYIQDLEIKAISAYNSLSKTGHGYNLHSGGGSCPPGYTVDYRSDDVPLCVFGLWFPNVRTACRALNINKKTVYARMRKGTLHLEERPLKAVSRNKMGSKEDRENRSSIMKGVNSGSSNGMFGKKNLGRSRKVLISGIEYPSISEAVRQTGYTKSQIEKRLYKKIEGFQYI